MIQEYKTLNITSTPLSTATVAPQALCMSVAWQTQCDWSQKPTCQLGWREISEAGLWVCRPAGQPCKLPGVQCHGWMNPMITFGQTQEMNTELYEVERTVWKKEAFSTIYNTQLFIEKKILVPWSIIENQRPQNERGKIDYTWPWWWPSIHSIIS